MNNAAAKLQVPSHSTAAADISSARRTDPVNVWAHGYYTVGTRGRLALTMIVLACVFCGRAHRHNGRPDFTSGKRKASCGHGTYVVHLGTAEGQVAA